ncbi:hypothetical protein MHK_005178 [Candidatus Magnetomorum sp. HK-1]|nr:hypothetical protein MHK_005178 [Candidatus Magnetomorum sp. HK-1]
MFSFVRIIVAYICIFILCVNFFAIVEASNLYLKAPDPKYYKSNTDLLGCDIDESVNLGYTKTNKDWIVYADKDYISLYNSPEEKRVVNVINFLDEFFVINLTKKYVLVEAKNKKVKGWGKVEDFIILPNYLKAPAPYLYKRPSDLWGSIAYESIESDWQVFAAKDNLALYRSPKENKVAGVFNYLNEFFVIKMTEKHILVETKYKKKGWGKVKDFIILTHAYKTNNSINHKAVLLNKVGSIEDDIDAVKPLRGPFSNAIPTEKTIRILDFAYIYSYYPNKKEPSFVLISKKPYFLPYTDQGDPYTIYNSMLGWVPISRVRLWCTREALEPNINRDYPIYYFKNKEDIESYYKDHDNDNKCPRCNNVPLCQRRSTTKDDEILVIRPDFEDNIDRNTWPPEIFRYMILKSNNDITKPFEIGIASATMSDQIFKKNVDKSIDTIYVLAKSMDIVFLIDATMSMSPYFEQVGTIAKSIMGQFNRKNIKFEQKLRFGVVLYRDYLNDKKDLFEINTNLTTNTAKIQQNLKNIRLIKRIEKVGNLEDPAYYPEAVFQALIKTINKNHLDWKKGTRKLIVHIGDAGNHSRGKDTINEKEIAQKMVENDISYCAIQLVSPSKNEEHCKAQKLFCFQVISIIRHIAEISLKKSQEEDQGLFKLQKNDINRFNLLINNSKKFDFNKKEVCSPLGESRWMLKCVPTNDIGEYKKTIVNRIYQHEVDIVNVMNILDDIRMGSKAYYDPNIPKNEKNTLGKNTSSRPFLMPGVINSLALEIGNNLMRRKDDPEIRAKIIKYIGKSNIKRIYSINPDKKLIKSIGKKELEVYLNNDIKFFTTAYVYFKRPGEKNQKSPNQFVKAVLFEKEELGRLLSPFDQFHYKWHGRATPDNIRPIMRDFILAIVGESDDVPLDPKYASQSINSLFEIYRGISLRSNHPILKMKYSDIKKGFFSSDIDLPELSKYLINTRNRLKKLYLNRENDERYFSVFGQKFIWIYAYELP